MVVHRLIIPAAVLAAMTVSGAPLASANAIHHHRHIVRSHRTFDAPRAYPEPFAGAAPYRAYRAPVAGTPPDNAFDPTRPYGGQAAITAPPGTAAFEEQANERRYFCEFAPEHC
jgi:hypothetical protein